MNGKTEHSPLRWLFLDLNAYFASCEQQEDRALRGRAVVIVQTLTETSCVIAASYEAKRAGIKTGTLMREARNLCREVVPVKARHALYMRYHQRILDAVDTCLPVEKVLSIDEMACRLTGRESDEPAARDLAARVKRAICQNVGACMTCSIGLAPNVFLGKVGSDLQKPDGLVVLSKKNLPDALLGMKLQDIYGIGPRMEQRLNRFGIYDVGALWAASSDLLRRVWGGVNGALFHRMLHGDDVQPRHSSVSKSMGHQHVLEPELRTNAGAKAYARHLLSKAAEKIRRNNYYCRRLTLGVAWCGNIKPWSHDIGFHETWDTAFLLARLENLWDRAPLFKPLAVNVVLSGLVPVERHQPDLFMTDSGKCRLSPLVDKINDRFGRGAIGFGLNSAKVREFTGHAAFQRVPEEWEF